MDVVTRRRFLAQGAIGAGALAAAPLLPAAADRFVPGPRTRVGRHADLPRFFIDGHPYSKPIFETYVPDAKYFRQFASAGTDIFSFSTNLGNGFSQPTWLGPEHWDFTQLDEVARSHTIRQSSRLDAAEDSAEHSGLVGTGEPR